jgi:hypothetical protein
MRIAIRFSHQAERERRDDEHAHSSFYRSETKSLPQLSQRERRVFLNQIADYPIGCGRRERNPVGSFTKIDFSGSASFIP